MVRFWENAIFNPVRPYTDVQEETLHLLYYFSKLYFNSLLFYEDSGEWVQFDYLLNEFLYNVIFKTKV